MELTKLTATAIVNRTRIGAYTRFPIRRQKQSGCTAAGSLIFIEDEALGTFADETVEAESLKLPGKK